MRYIGYGKCADCDKEYYGEFKINMDGSITCKDCENIKKSNQKLEYRIADSRSDINRKLLMFLREDLSILYPIYATADDDITSPFIHEGKPDAKKMYYMGNDLKFVYKMRDIAYECVKYRDSNFDDDDKYIEYADKIIQTYLDLRIRKFTEKQVNAFKRLVRKKEMNVIREYNSFS